MSTGIDAGIVKSLNTVKKTATEPARVHTTLFDLIAALQEAADPGDDTAVVASVVDLMETGRIRLCTPLGEYHERAGAGLWHDCIKW